MSTSLQLKRLGTAPNPVRIVHIGLGAFHRAHQAWYTELAQDGWGIAAFTGRAPKAAEQLNSQGGLYTLITRGPQHDTFEVIGSISESHDGADLMALANLVGEPTTSVITLTITEAGYLLSPSSSTKQLNADDLAVQADLDALRQSWMGQEFELDQLKLSTTPARLTAALAHRKVHSGAPITVLSCDNLPENGAAARAGILEFAAQCSAELASWIEQNVSFASSSVDRITPKTTADDIAAVLAETGTQDVSPVVTEPFSSWVIQGKFPAGRPAWETAGAQFVDNLEPFEQRKLWLLNGAHSLMAYAGQMRGHVTVAQALGDPVIERWVEEFWDEAAQHLVEPELNVPAYRASLRARFANPRIAHYLAQITQDGTLKLAARALPVAAAENACGRPGLASLRAIASWCDWVVAQHAAGEHITDPQAERLELILEGNAADSSSIETTQKLVHLLNPDGARDHGTITSIHTLRGTFANATYNAQTA